VTQAAAKASLELHGRELEPNLPLTVYISNPERKKERTDADAADKEIYVAGLSRFTKEGDLQRLFKTVRFELIMLSFVLSIASQYGTVKQIRMETDKDNNCRGFAFIEFDDEVGRQFLVQAR
jgi:RNA recognition motif-containing protein